MKTYLVLCLAFCTALASQAVLAQDATTTTAQAPAQPAVSDQEAINTARAQGHNMADRINATYGQVEQRVYSYVYGVRSGMTDVKEAIGADESNSNFYRSGYATGQTKALGDGDTAGKNQAQDATAAGAQEAVSRFDAVLDKGTQPNLVLRQVTAPQLNFDTNCAARMTDADAIETIKQDTYIQFIFSNLSDISSTADEYGLGKLLQQTDYTTSIDLGGLLQSTSREQLAPC